MNTHIRSALVAALALSTYWLGAASAAADIPPRPEQLVFAPLKFEPPSAKEFRRTLPNGVPVYMAPSSEFPLVTITFTFKGGDYLDPPTAPGLASLTAALMRSAGTTTIKPADLDEELDFLAARASVAGSDVACMASLNCLKSNLDDSFELFMDMLRNPGFDADRVNVQKANSLEDLKQRNDDGDTIMAREWARLIYGPDHFEAREMTQASLEAITPDMLRSMHQRIFHPGNLIISVTGDFEPAPMMARLETALEGWPKGEISGDPPAPKAQLTPGVYHVQKDIPQGKVFIGTRSLKRDDPDYIAVMVMNDILGGGGFTSRIMQSVRSNEGLAYSAGSTVAPNVWYPGEFRALFQSKNPTVALAIKLINDELDRIRREPVSKQELETTQRSFIETFPQNFSSKDSMLRIFVTDEMTNRPDGYWRTFRDKINAITPEDLQRVAQKYLDPSKMAILVVGDWDTIYAGNERASMKDFFKGNVEHLPLRDPLTLEPLK